LRKQILLAAMLAALALVAGVFQTARTALNHSFGRLEADEARQNVERVRQALQADLRQLDVAAEDYALWDDFYDFVQRGGPPAELGHYFSRAGMENVHVNVVWVLDQAGRTVVQISTEAPPGEVGTLSAETLRKLNTYAAQLHSAAYAQGSAVQFVRTPHSALAVSVRPVSRALWPAQNSGMLLFGRYMDGALTEGLHKTSQSPVRVTLLDDSGKPTLVVPPAVAAWLANPNADDVFVQTRDSQTLGSHALLRDVAGNPLMVLSTTESREALQIARRTINWVVAALLMGFALVVLLLVSLLNRSWRSRAATQRQWLDHQRKISRIARRDSLTGLPNRLHLQRLLPKLLKRAARDRVRLALLNIDLDHFKNINDSLGHGIGDKLLAAVALRLRTAVTENDLVVRMGGDEFVVVATMLEDSMLADAVAERIRLALSVPMEIDGVTLTVAPSIGISVFPEDGSDAEQLLKHADIALYTAKERGRGNHQFYTPEMNLRLRERVELERALRQALYNNELTVEYQPCFDLTSLRTVSMEALIRWRTSDGHDIPPSRFIPIAEQTNLIVEIGDYVLRRVCLQLSEWQRERLPLVPISVNISVRQLESAPLASRVATLAQELGIDASLLYFEITEGAAMQNTQQHLGSLQALRNLGSRILIDDFGTGYSSLSYLKHLPIDTLKIDRAFVRDMAADANDAAIVRAIVAVAKSLGLMLVAEGIESEEQLECLRELGCECGQGFLVSPPISPERCVDVLRQLRIGRQGTGETTKVRHLSSVS
jgi:diguanylate cyclase (GGDEF)-like protein